MPRRSKKQRTSVDTPAAPKDNDLFRIPKLNLASLRFSLPPSVSLCLRWSLTWHGEDFGEESPSPNNNKKRRITAEPQQQEAPSASQLQVFKSDDLLGAVFGFLPNDCYRYIAGVDRKFRTCYLKRQREGERWFWKDGRTSLVHAVASPDHAKIFFQEMDGFLARRKRNKFNFCLAAAAHGKLEVLELGRAHPACDWSSQVSVAAAEGGHLEILQWILANGDKWHSDTVVGAARKGQLHILQWALAQGYRRSKLICRSAARGGHLNVLKWARHNGFSWDAKTCSAAAYGGHLEVIQWARANGCNWNADTCSAAAKMGHLGILQWARANGCPWNAATRYWANQRHHVDVLQWAIDHGCPESFHHRIDF